MSASGKKHFQKQIQGENNPDSLCDQNCLWEAVLATCFPLRKVALLSPSSQVENRAYSLTFYLYPKFSSHSDKI